MPYRSMCGMYSGSSQHMKWYNLQLSDFKPVASPAIYKYIRLQKGEIGFIATYFFLTFLPLHKI